MVSNGGEGDGCDRCGCLDEEVRVRLVFLRLDFLVPKHNAEGQSVCGVGRGPGGLTPR